MKKILLFVCLVLAVQTVWSQDEDDEKKKKIDNMFGVYIGFNYARLTGKDEHSNPRWGAQFGAYIGLLHSKRYMIDSRVLFSMQGANFGESSIYGSSYKSSYALNYIVIPITFDYMITDDFCAGIGLQPGILLSAKYKQGDQTSDIKKQMKTFDLGVPIQVQYNFSPNMYTNLRIVPGVLNMFDNSSLTKTHNLTGTLGVGYNF